MRTDYFGEDVAAGYDSDGEGMSAPAVVDPAADFLAALAREAGPDAPSALEFAVGTGRIALPLAARGVEVHGVDLSDAMLARLRAKPGSGLRVVEVRTDRAANAALRSRMRAAAVTAVGERAPDG